jgi:3-oxoadipate enol-lactonase
MPVIDADGCLIHVEVTGSADAPALMLSNSLGSTLHMWDPQAKAFAEKFRLVRYDGRGHGKSGAPKGPYSIELLGRDAMAVMDHLGLKKVNWLGLSMGGMIGQWLGANATDRIDKLILSNTSCYYADKTPWEDRIKAVRAGGVKAISDRVINVWLTKGFQEREPKIKADMMAMMAATPVEGYIGCCAAIRDMDQRDLLGRIKAPTLVIAGSQDPATNVETAEFIRSSIPGAKLAVIVADNIANVEQPQAYTNEVLAFLT